MKRSFFALMAALLLVLTAFPVLAQEQTSSIEGTIMDGSGAALPGVTVEAVNAKGQRFSAQTDSSGKYRFPSIPPGQYTVTWNGRDDRGGVVDQGAYRVVIEAAREHGSYQLMQQDLTLGAKPVAADLGSNEEIGRARVEYRHKK